MIMHSKFLMCIFKLIYFPVFQCTHSEVAMAVVVEAVVEAITVQGTAATLLAVVASLSAAALASMSTWATGKSYQKISC